MNENLKETASHILNDLSEMCLQLGDERYAKPLETLSGNSIGKHIRHIIEFFECMKNGIQHNKINYDLRERNPDLETQTKMASRILLGICSALSADTRMNMTLCGSYDLNGNDSYQVPTSFYRELVYNIEHAIHHMAIIRIAVKTEFPLITIPAGFGIAFSTIKYEQICAQ